DDDTRLPMYNIIVPSNAPIPTLLQHHIDHVVNAPRASSSPAAKNIRRDQPRAEAATNEHTAIDILKDNVLFKAEAAGGERYVDQARNINLLRRHLPSAPSDFVEQIYGALTQPQPNTAVGYITERAARGASVHAPFSIQEEAVLNVHAVCEGLHFPFLTCQWKSAKSSQGHWHAERQGARDGATLVNAIHKYLTCAGKDPTVVETCHWSLTCDISSINLFVHWRAEENGIAKFHSKKVEQEFLHDLKDPENPAIVRMRRLLRNILNYSLGTRLTMIRDAIPAIQA
ncbi:hypothetical protein BU26DRAFT_389367, partial [Trematosphaeria pertusa]